MWNKFLDSPFVLAFFVGLYPVVFYFSNNWFIFETSRIMLILGAFSVVIFLALTLFYLGLSWLFKRFLNNNSFKIKRQLYVLGSILALAYFLRHTFYEISGNGLYLALGLSILILGLGYFSPKEQIYYLNALLMMLCLVNIGSGLNSMYFTTKTNTFVGKDDDAVRQNIYDQVKFKKHPNVYYIIPDGYPNREGLKKIFNLDNNKMYHHLESWGFSLNHLALSNYRSTLSSLASVFGMQHHYYKGSVGNFELLYSREFIVSNKNPVTKIFKNNGYQVHYAHEQDIMFAKGCFIDFCFPESFWGIFIDIFIPFKLQTLPFIAKGIGRSPEERMEIILNHIDEISTLPMNYFTYIHLNSPSHSPTSIQNRKSLASFRETFPKKIQLANEKIIKVVDRILTRDPNALIILNADHGGWGLGAYKHFQVKLFEGVPDELIALDHLGVLLAIRWPEKNAAVYGLGLRTNINLFRHIFAYLSETQVILTTKVPDDGYLTKGNDEEDSILMKVVHDGKILKHMNELGPLKK